MDLHTMYAVAAVYEFSIFAVGAFEIADLIKRYIERRTKATLFLCLAILLLLSAIFMAAFSRILRFTGAWEVAPGKFLELLVFSVSLIVVADVFYLAFTLEVFHEGFEKRGNRVVLVVYAALVALSVIYFLASGLFTVDLTEGIWMVVFALSIPVYVFMIRDARKLLRKLPEDDYLDRKSTAMISFSPMLILGTLFLFLLDRVFGGNFTVFYFLAWAFALASTFTIYLGFVRPEWYKRRVEAKHERKAHPGKAD
ncbi:MAG: hypothetical protein ACTSU5_05345 [Promethearchaeota archaeon]